MSFIVNYPFIQNLKLLESDEFNYLTLILTRTLVMRRGKKEWKRNLERKYDWEEKK